MRIAILLLALALGACTVSLPAAPLKGYFCSDGQRRSTPPKPPTPRCTAVRTAPAVLTGTVADRQRTALPPGATVSVELRDVSRADAPAPVVAVTMLTPAGNQAPLHWFMRYDPSQLIADHDYAVRARIADADGKLIFTSNTRYPVLTKGAAIDGVDIIVVPAGG